MEQILKELDSLFASGQTKQVEPFLIRHLEQAEQEGEYASAVTLRSELGGFYRACGRLEESEQAFRSAAGYMEKDGRERESSYGTLLINLAGTLRLQKRVREAMELYDRAEEVLAEIGERGYLLASLYNNRSLALQDMDCGEEAVMMLKKALSLIREIPGSEEEQAITHTNLAVLLGNTGRPEEEEEELEQALFLFREMNCDNNPHFAAALSAMGNCCFRRGEYARALDAYEQAARLMLKLFGKNREYEVILHNAKQARQKIAESGGMAESGGEEEAVEK